jgi:diguanylate cyclase (GGDEF)-like protein/PAS domain S-box-containing protein
VKRFFVYWRHWWLLGLGLIAVGAYLTFNLVREHDRIEAAERERLTTQSKVIEDNLKRQLTAINLTLESIMVELPGWANRAAGRAEGVQHLKGLDAAMPSVLTFVVLDARGTVILSNQNELLGRNFYQREYFQAPMHSLNPKTLYVGQPFKSVLDNYIITLSRVVKDATGRFAGVVVATVDPGDIRILLSSVNYADDMRSMLLHGDGKVFVSEPALANASGSDLSAPGSFFSRHLKSGRAVSDFKGLDDFAPDARLSVIRSVDPAPLAMDKPLVVMVSRSLEPVFGQWQRDARNQSLAYLLLVLVSSLGLRSYRRQRALQRVSATRLRLATEASGIGIWEFNLTTRRYHWDSAMFALFGLNPQTVNERNDDWRQLLLPGELQRMKDATRATIEHGQPFDLIFQIQRKDGQPRYLRNRAALYRDDRGLPNRLIGATEDITGRKLQEEDLRIAAATFESHESLLVTDANAVILRVNHAFTELFGYSAEEAVGQTPRILKSDRHEPAFYAALWQQLLSVGKWQGEIWNRRKNGDVFPEWLVISAVHNDEGLVTHYVATHVDITLRKAAEEEIRNLAFFDPLTGLPNRRLLQDRLHQAIVKAKRDKHHLALLFIDLDKFKPINDDYGHQAGDELLLAVARRLRACVRESDTVARVGGDEFVVLLPGLELPEDASAVARKIHDALIEPFSLSGGQSVNISSSTGIATYPEHGSDETQLMQHADAAMYQAKAGGRDRFVVFEASL